ncbi:unnamed protein product [Polarella glacialis]|uniref:Uncharacterized protein n=1 Tax=Polarella glacialis TaxID=89957 RepID=A0A813LMI4_POLGL|nr:unnamed protein product [Polarella glacialis]|mmetsp:Transcript_82053/g.148109  ORF Transcript_82053/g.148109 Transcript_82053/m.148109 type:complete len:148 (-) Transcript_82053:204-647(-)
MERSVVLADMPKTARLALRFPLGFLDSPAAMYAVFSSLRGNVCAAHWCATQFHQRLLKEVAKKIHGWWASEAEMPEELLYRGSHVGSLSKLLKEVLEALDRDLVSGPHGLGGCDAFSLARTWSQQLLGRPLSHCYMMMRTLRCFCRC